MRRLSALAVFLISLTLFTGLPVVAYCERPCDCEEKKEKESLDDSLDRLFFEARGWEEADPLAALNLYKEEKAKNPQLELYNEADKVKTMKQCAEAGTIGKDVFFRNYSEVKNQDVINNTHFFWQLAEEIINTSDYGPSRMKTGLQLACQGSYDVAAISFYSAIDEIYTAWKSQNNHFRFDVCNHASGNFTESFCFYRRHYNEIKELERLNYKPVTDHVWRIKGRDIPPACLPQEWDSSDNYEEYEKRLSAIKEVFHKRPGKFWITTVPMEPLAASWGGEVSLPQKIEKCLIPEKGVETTKGKNSMFSENKGEGWDEGYELLAEWDADMCERYLPQFKGACHSMAYVAHDYFIFNTYAHVTYKNEDYIIPVTNNLSLHEINMPSNKRGDRSLVKNSRE